MNKDPQHFDTIVLGAGLGGLATASILAQKGERVLVLERHYAAGGYATNFEREGFTFDVSLHSFDGVKDGTTSFEVVRACGVADRVEFIPHKKVYRFIAPDIDMSVADCDLAGYEKQLGDLFPLERANLRRLFVEAEKVFKQVGRFVVSSMPFWLKMVTMPFLGHKILKYEHTTVDKFFAQFIQDKRLRSLMACQWSYYGLPPEDLAYTYFSYPFIDYVKNGGYSIRGGSQSLSNAMVDVITEHGGEVLLTTPVKKILVRDGRVIGVEAKKRGTVYADKIISNLNPYATIKLAGEEAFPRKFVDELNGMEIAISGVQVYLGLDCTLQSLGVDPDDYIIFVGNQTSQQDQYQLMKANDIESGKTAFSLNLFSNIDSTLAPAGKSTLGLFSLCGGEYWHKLSRTEYEARKKSVTDTLIRQANQIIPQLSDHIEVCEMGTPRTMIRYTANPVGSFYGFAQSIPQSGMRRRFPQRYPLKGLYQVGAWTFPGAGYIGTLMSAKFLVDRYL